jgi:hypothetical protein
VRGPRKSVRRPHSCARIAATSFATDLFNDVDRKDAALFADLDAAPLFA